MAETKAAQGQSEDLGAWDEVIWAVLKIAFMVFVAVSGYLLVAAFRDRKQGRWGRVLLLLGLTLGGVYFLFGTPTSLTVLYRYRRDLSFTPNFLQLWEMHWHGLIAENFWDPFSGWVSGWHGRHRHGTNPFEVYDSLKGLAYLAAVATPFSGLLVGSAPAEWVPEAPYRILRWIFVKLMTPMTVLPLLYAPSSPRWKAALALLGELALGLSVTAWLSGWDSTSREGLVFPCVAFYLVLGSLYTLYLLTGGRQWVTRGKDAQTSPESFTFGWDEDTGARVGLTVRQLQYHVHLVGASGGGKSTWLWHVKEQHIRQGLGLIFVDLKADVDTVARVSALCVEVGRLGDLRVLDLSRPDLTFSYNPCLRGNATEIKDKIVGAFQWESEYYKNCAQSHLLALLRGFVFLRDERRLAFTLEDLLLATTSADAIVALELALSEARAPMEILEEVNHRASFLRSRENQRELSGLKTQLELLLHSEFGNALKSDRRGVDFFTAIRDQEIVTVLLNSQTYGETAVILGKLILQDLKSCSGEIAARISESERTHCTIVVDEFADLATEQFVGFLNRARGSKLGVVIAHQELSDLDRAGKHVRDQVVTNTATTISFLQKSPGSAEAIASLAGTRTVTKATKQVTETEILFWKDRKYTGVESEREVEEFQIHPNTIKSLKQGHCVAIGKFPSAWHARVAVNRPEYPQVDYGEAWRTLRNAREAAERQPSGFVALSLRARVRAFLDSNRKRGGDAATGLRTEATPELSHPAAAESADGDDRF